MGLRDPYQTESSAPDRHDLDDDIDATAKSMGLVVVEPADDELLLDIDDDIVGMMWMTKMLEVLRRNGVGVEMIKQTVSKSGNAHVYLRLDRRILTPMARIALQACLGSDRHREILSAVRVMMKCDRPPTVLFEVPDRAPEFKKSTGF